jgi:prolipoprotein diacylglyceryltransferase
MLNNLKVSVVTMLVIIYLQIAVHAQYVCIFVSYVCTTSLARMCHQSYRYTQISHRRLINILRYTNKLLQNVEDPSEIYYHTSSKGD